MGPQKPMENWSYAELVDYATWQVIKCVVQGDLRQGVTHALDLAFQWHEKQREKAERKGIA